MLLQVSCPKCSTTVDVEPQGSAKCPNCGTSVAGWTRKTSRSDDDKLPKRLRGQARKGGGGLLVGVLIVAGIICCIFVSIWVGLILVGIGAILAAVSRNA